MRMTAVEQWLWCRRILSAAEPRYDDRDPALRLAWDCLPDDKGCAKLDAWLAEGNASSGNVIPEDLKTVNDGLARVANYCESLKPKVIAILEQGGA